MSYNQKDDKIPFDRCKECERSFETTLMTDGLCPACNDELIDDLNRQHTINTLNETLEIAVMYNDNGRMASYAIGVMQHYLNVIASDEVLWKIIKSISGEMTKRMTEERE